MLEPLRKRVLSPIFRVYLFYATAALWTFLGLKIFTLRRKQAAQGQTANVQQNLTALKKTFVFFLIDAIAYTPQIARRQWRDCCHEGWWENSDDVEKLDRGLTYEAVHSDLVNLGELTSGLYSLNFLVLVMGSPGYRRMAAKTASKWRIVKVCLNSHQW